MASTAGGGRITVWQKLPGAGGPPGAEQISARGAVSNIAMPTIDIIAPPRPNGAAILIAAGGGYKRIELVHKIDDLVIEHRLTKPRHPWTNGQVERMNRTIKDATVKRSHYDSHDQLRSISPTLSAPMISLVG